MSTSVLNVSTSDNIISTDAKSLKSIDVDDIKKQDIQYDTTKSVAVKVIKEEVYEGKEVEIESENQTVSISEKLEDAELASINDEQESIDDAESELFDKEMALALDHVRKLALFQQEALVNSICDTFVSFNGKEASVNDIFAIFGRIKSEFAAEAAEDEENEVFDEIDDEIDSDYHPNDDLYDYDLDNDANEDYAVSDVEDSDYDPNDAEDIKQGQADLDEDGFDDLSDSEIEEENLEKISFDEEAIINSEEFDTEYFEAIECVVNAAKLEKERIYGKIIKKYQDEFGDEAIEKAFEQFVDFEFEQESDSENDDDEEENDTVSDDEVDDSSEYRKEMDFALDNVRKLAAKHREAFVNEVCEGFKGLNGFEPSVSELSSIFSAIKAEFAEEARKDFLDDIESEDDDEEIDEEQDEIVNVD